MSEFVTRAEVADTLGVSEPSVDKLIETGLIKGAQKIGRTRAIPEREATQLAGREHMPDSHPPLLIVKVRGAHEDNTSDPRPWTGWNPDRQASDPDQIEAIRKYWRVANPDRYVNERLAVTTAGFIHATYWIHAYTDEAGGTRAFDITYDDSKIGKSLARQRFKALPGNSVELR